MFRRIALVTLLLALACLPGPQSTVSTGAAPSEPREQAEVVVRLGARPLAHGGSRAAIERTQRDFVQSLSRAFPEAHVRWRYRLVLDGVSVVLPAGDVERLRQLPGVSEVFTGARYAVTAGPAGAQIGAPALWAPGLTNAGDGIKIAIIDGGFDQRHPFFDPTGYTMPAGYPKGQPAYTTAKVIVARSFPAPGQTGGALLPFEADSSSSAHATHVAGIAAGNANTNARGSIVSGVAPRAYLGNYRALTVPTDGGVGEDGNAPELVAAIEAAVADGMNVINLSIGQAEIEPTRDVVALALGGAAAAGVVPVVAAGNDLDQYGAGSVVSPGSSAAAITVGAVTTSDAGGTPNVTADFSSAGPSPLSLRLKPDVSAPGVSIFSSLPDGWGRLSGTSMATPHVSGGVALLRQRHPDWSVAQIKAALVETANDAFTDEKHQTAATPTRGGSGVVDLARADQPLVFALPSSLSFGLLRPGATVSRQVDVSDAGGGGGTWTATLERATAPRGVTVAVAPTVEVPGSLMISATAAADAAEGDAYGFAALTRGTDVRRIPYWFRMTRPRLGTEPATPLRRPGIYAGTTKGGKSLVRVYRYPQLPTHDGVATVLAGPERVYRVVLSRAAANLGVAIISRAPGVRVEPRVVVAGDENRLTGYAALPFDQNPYLAGYGEPTLVAGTIRPTAGSYDIVFDSATAAGAGRFRFRFWVDDTTPPTAKLLTRNVRTGGSVVLRATDAGAGVDAGTIVARIDGQSRKVIRRGAEVRVDTRGLAPGRHRLTFQVSDYQETRNMENVPAILPNTRRLTATIVVR
jgi:subtilisin family serine protease